jgi:PA domain
MKHIATLLFFAFAGTCSAQVACDILTPGPLYGSYAHTWAEPAAGSWNTPDMMDPLERVVGELALAFDASAADSLCCEPLITAGVSGKIAVLYRGTCDYSLKAKYCQDAGAIAVVIINNLPGAPAGMGAGDVGTQVTIPVFQIRQDHGALWRAALETGETIEVLLGNKDGFYAYDAGLRDFNVLLPPALATPRLLTANPGEYLLQVASHMQNYGTETMTGLQLRATVMHDGLEIYEQTSAVFDIEPGDSAFVVLPDFAQPSWTGRYELTYTVLTGTPDEHAMDNSITIPFEFEDVFALAPIDDATGIPVTTIGIQPATSNGEYESCVHFRDANASRVAITGVDRYASITTPLQLGGELVFTRVYQWMDNFTGLSDAAFDINLLEEVHNEMHILDVTENPAQFYLPFADPVPLLDNMRYLICTATINPEIFFGYNEDVHYATHQQVYDQPACPNRNGSDWFVGFVGGPVASIGVRTIDANTIGINEEAGMEVGASPNPGNGIFHVALGAAGPALLTVRDATGRVVTMQRSTSDRVVLDLTNEAPGVYVLSVEGDRGRAVARLVKE